jgi:hypothetical protein
VPAGTKQAGGEACVLPLESGGVKQNPGTPMTDAGREQTPFRWGRAFVTSVTFLGRRGVYLANV